MIDSIYQSVQARLNKEQLGYLKPLYYNLFLKNAQRKLVNKLLLDVKTHVRKSNWLLDGRNYADYSEHTKQLLEWYADTKTLISPFALTSDVEFIEDVYFGDVPVDKIDYSDFLLLNRNVYAKPKECNPVCSLVGRNLKINPSTIEEVELHFIRQPLTPKWTFDNFQGKAAFNPDKPDFQDVDMPPFAEDELVSLVTESSSKYLRQFQMVEAENRDQAQDFQTENRQ